ncbi:MAG: hypothetical protein DRJ68_03490 [Thermoprotei archaeon]|nr:MAG: hypothetical protein DRJ68_03490 [Thermoprotei archaeon]
MKKYLALGFVAGIFVALIAVWVSPPQEDFHLENPYWNGLSTFTSLFDATPLQSVDELTMYDASSSALLIIGPSLSFSQEFAYAVKRFLDSGGLLVVADDFGSANNLLDKLDLKIRISRDLLLDPLMKGKSRELPVAFNAQGGGDVEKEPYEEVLLNMASTVITENSNCKVVLASSEFSFLDLNGNRELDEEEPRGPFSVACVVELDGGGRVVVISDPSIFINSMILERDNVEFIRAVIENRTVLIDCSHWAMSPSSLLRSWINSALQVFSSYELRYVIPIAIALALWKLKARQKKAKG